MVLKRSKYIFCLCFSLWFAFNVKAQNTADTFNSTFDSNENTNYSDETDYEKTNTSNYTPNYHFSDSEVVNHTLYVPKQKFDEKYWLKECENLNFEEDSLIKKDKPKNNKKPVIENFPNKKSNSFSLASLKYLWLILALIILGLIMVYLINNSRIKNTKFKNSSIINFDEIDEDSIKDLEIDLPLNAALLAKDYKTAYRLKYLKVLKQLIAKNLIFYKKEKTNYEYLIQLSGKTIYDPFRMLTFNFDGIWYGEMPINEQIYLQLDIYFSDFNLKLKSN